MAKVPGWKIRRELGRLGQQLSAIPEAIWEPLAQARHDRELLARWPVRNGQHPGVDRVAALLIWQPEGIAPSVFRTISHLSDAGYAPFVISNAPVSEKDRGTLDAAVWKWMERPNFGYDFGGYRDALRVLKSWNADPERLVILNDSMWFPLSGGDEALARLEALEADVAGSILRRRDGADFLESYIFSVSSRTWRSEAFWAWPYEIGGEFGGARPDVTKTFDAEDWGAAKSSPAPRENTTIACIATDAALTRDEAERVAQMALAGMARAIRPVFAPTDGDVVFVISTARRVIDGPRPMLLARIGELAASTLARSIARGVHEAERQGDFA